MADTTQGADAEVVLTRTEGRTRIITINRPEVRNAIDSRVARALADAVIAADDDPEIWTVVLTGAGDRAFSAGADLKAVFAGEVVHDPDREHLGFAGFVRLDIAKPVIAAVDGFALGGGFEIVLHCDLAVASQSATFGFPEARVGKMAAAGGAFRIGRQIPPKLAAEMLYTGAAIPASRALELGLVNRVVADGHALEAALALADEINANSPLSVRASKRTLLGIDHGDAERDSADWDRIREEDATLLRSHDAQEGVRAFVEKRAPRWTGR
ncbi:enoyl-CoA hydratase-related protein [Microbacterium fluvii]|uniref:Enoyl-CoA hydratase-related protein n=1 Tax=Microbacterium fluvii TaxID=415215 RepID=A0ABW2HFD5_9MICO|nr:enoyl-CoA hydratase-related protein [Microbacterium fluvii]MCU4672785.1 enoyl-CoA hydratase-related protein [Microbacterium fluvii]